MTTMERLSDGNSHVCDICEDENCDVAMVSRAPSGKRYVDYAWHIRCIRYRKENPNNNREARGMAELLKMALAAA